MEENERELRQATNEVSGNGYLKSFDLKRVTSQNGTPAISGTVTLAFDTKSSINLQVYCTKTTMAGESKTYIYLEEMMNGTKECFETVTKRNSAVGIEMTPEQIIASVAKVFVRGSLSPWEYYDDNDNLISIMRIRLSYIGDANPNADFEPVLNYRAEMFIEELKNEEDEEGKPTGRGIISGIMPMYKGEIANLSMIVPANFKTAVFATYGKDRTVELYGVVQNTVTEIVEENKVELAFGVAPVAEKSVKFKTELILTGGSQVYSLSNERNYKKEDIQEAKLARVDKLTNAKQEYSKKKKEVPEVKNAPKTFVFD